ncbi:MAG: hypothetical protein A4E73_04022 [Syntrophaceae bacterium PtaU1.Bin231]|nr:MAG: hypothetical protein A4E73_04022 [Syntrophaceae bacterium PtaU1.Bin231]
MTTTKAATSTCVHGGGAPLPNRLRKIYRVIVANKVTSATTRAFAMRSCNSDRWGWVMTIMMK